MKRMSVEEYRAARALEAARTHNKFGACRVSYQGHVFDSKAEMRRYCELRLLEQAEKIGKVKLHPRFVLQEGFVAADGEHIAPITYTADFMYVEGGREVVEDVKGGKATQTTAFRIRLRLFKKKFPHIELRIVGDNS